jgi:hypothetical protein
MDVQPITYRGRIVDACTVECFRRADDLAYSDVEKTMIELQRTTIMLETQSAVHNAMQHKFIVTIEDLSGRDVLAFISNRHVGPDVRERRDPVPNPASGIDGRTFGPRGTTPRR